jgi:hypothetical protein
MEFKSTVTLRPGRSAAEPIRLTLQGPLSEDRERSEVEVYLAVEDADALARGLTRAALWVAEGVWKPGAVEAPTP